MASARIECEVERLLYELQIAQFDPDKHLRERESHYVNVALDNPPCLFVIRETEDGWWKEAIDMKKNIESQIEKLKSDPTVACGWTIGFRFNQNGGWESD